ncbi:hypothetical protein WMF18_42370 [Sorangium sp. So ce315]|uniref:hypothetical protein n=1 Tax=Sorangium sp. So ce315 TaxID=3133299 RepID=UPI003F5FE383
MAERVGVHVRQRLAEAELDLAFAQLVKAERGRGAPAQRSAPRRLRTRPAHSLDALPPIRRLSLEY